MSSVLSHVICPKCGLSLTGSLPPGEAVEIGTVDCKMDDPTPHHVVNYRVPPSK